ncbi:hypothetical protein [Actinoplanes sp. L3-i22]|uniref:hypothetical protein n=1 Tax=Actinoplanes sp. L3-i22 TaxID=2836373 RepID=UPI001C763963|nr:hypothetical protein [Actinoplanes sp. L3-i22]BCY11999.1 hypothetical protein L3i22_070870 [Actinoplanes sp. L3-i22]
MQLREARLLAIPFALLAVLLRLAQGLWVHPSTRDTGRLLQLAVSGAAFAVSLFLPVLIYWLITRQFWKRPAAWSPGFSAGPSLSQRGIFTIMLGWQAGNALDFARESSLGWGGLVFLAAALVFLAGAIAAPMINRHSVRLDPDGITYQGLLRRRRTRWDEPFRVPTGGLHIDPAYLSVSLNFYRTHPERRAELAEVTV